MWAEGECRRSGKSGLGALNNSDAPKCLVPTRLLPFIYIYLQTLSDRISSIFRRQQGRRGEEAGLGGDGGAT